MKTPVDVVRGRIVGYDEKRQEALIRAPYGDWYTLTRREYKECLVQMIDSRPLSDKQRKLCYALLREISEYTGYGMDPTKELMKIKFLAEDLEEYLGMHNKRRREIPIVRMRPSSARRKIHRVRALFGARRM